MDTHCHRLDPDEAHKFEGVRGSSRDVFGTKGSRGKAITSDSTKECKRAFDADVTLIRVLERGINYLKGLEGLLPRKT